MKDGNILTFQKMKKIYAIMVFAVLALMNTSCLKMGLDELETYDLNDITNVRFEYRWYEESAEQMNVMEMTVSNDIDAEGRVIECSITVPAATGKFTDEIRSQVSLNALAINVDASTAARIAPVDGAPVMGVFPSDFSAGEFKYTVMAGNGDKAEWTIRIVDFRK